MTTISELNQTNSTATNTNSTSQTGKTNSLGQSDFLNLLVAQLQNQDPLNPSDPTEFTSQLAQYSQLEQLFNLNSAMNSLTDAQTSSQKISTLSLIGKDVVVEDSKFSYDGNPTKVGYSADGTASTIQMQIRNSAGSTVATIDANDTSKGDHFVTWNGKDKNGNALPAGTYTVAISATSTDSSSTVAISPLVHAKVTGVDLSGSQPMVVTANGEYNISTIHGASDVASTTTNNSSTATTGST